VEPAKEEEEAGCSQAGEEAGESQEEEMMDASAGD
jgi:hypothetical protein